MKTVKLFERESGDAVKVRFIGDPRRFDEALEDYLARHHELRRDWRTVKFE